jgi:hypothetical protein
MAMDGSEHIYDASRGMPVVPDPMRLVGQSGVTGATWNGVGDIPAAVSQGWKLYVSATLANYIRTLKVVGPVFHDHSVPFKYLSNLSRVRDQNAGLFGFSQVGKCVVAYLHDTSKILTVLAALRGSLENIGHEGPFVPRLPAAWSGASVFYRYGSYRAKCIEIAGMSHLDDRRDPLSVMDLVDANPFVSANDVLAGDETVQPVGVGTSILARFPAVSAICRSGKGGVFRAIDMEDPVRTGVIVKIGLQLGSALPDGRDGAHFLDREWHMYGAMRGAGLRDVLAKPIAFSKEEGANVLVLEEIHGVDLAVHRARSTSDPSQIGPAIRLIRRFHRAGFSLGDAKAANFMLRGEDLMVVDLESACLLCRSQDTLPMTFLIAGLPSIGLEARDIFHFLVSLIYPAGRDGMVLSQARLIRLPELPDEAASNDAWDREAVRLLRVALEMLPRDPSLGEFDRALL